MRTLRRHLRDESASAAFAATLIEVLPQGFFYLALSGGLGAGKTHLVRSLLRALGEGGAVRSPTYTLLEDYQLPGRRLVHMDLYRLSGPEELEYLGLRELLGQDLLLCVEWPERATGWLPTPDLNLDLQMAAQGGRMLSLESGSAAGARLIAALEIALSATASR